jgi:tubulin-folding cofactor B
MTIAALKLKLATHTGTSAEDMALTLSDGAGGAPAIPLTDPARPLGFYSPEDGATLRVTDTNPHSLAATGWLEDTSKVEKYVMSDAEYAGREGTYRAYKEERRKVRGEKKKKKKRER